MSQEQRQLQPSVRLQLHCQTRIHVGLLGKNWIVLSALPPVHCPALLRLVVPVSVVTPHYLFPPDSSALVMYSCLPQHEHSFMIFREISEK